MKLYEYAMRLMIDTCINIVYLNKYIFCGARSYLKKRY